MKLLLLWLSLVMPAFDNGQYGDVPDHVRQWFKGVRSPHGVPCCDIADGHRTQWDTKGNDYWIPDPLNEAGPWIKVPSDVVVHNAGNPTGDAIVWWVRQAGPLAYIRCFVPGAGI